MKRTASATAGPRPLARADRRPAGPADAGGEDRAAAPVPGAGRPARPAARFRTGTEALHGLAWLGPATVFPQAVGLASTWNPELVRRVGEAVGDEVRGLPPQGPDRGRAQRLGAGGQPAARPPLGPQRGGLLRGPVADRRHGHRLRRAACAASDPDGAEDRAHAQALPRLQQRDRPLHHLQQPAAAGAARVRAARLPARARSGRRGRRHALLQPGQRPPGAPQPADQRGAAGLDAATTSWWSATPTRPATSPALQGYHDDLAEAYAARDQGRARQLHPGRRPRRGHARPPRARRWSAACSPRPTSTPAVRHALSDPLPARRVRPRRRPYDDITEDGRQLPRAPGAGPRGGPAVDRAAAATTAIAAR